MQLGPVRRLITNSPHKPRWTTGKPVHWVFEVNAIEHQVEFASTCEAEVEEYLSERPELLIAGPTFLPIPEAEIPKALRRLVVQGVCVPECPKLMA